VRVVYLSRNFGHQTALTAGLDHARGDAVVMLDADLQDPPEVITTMLDHWRAGCDVVYAVREQRDGESRFKLSTARWFYRLFDKLAQVELQHNSGDFRLLDRRPLDALLSMRERNRFLRGMTVSLDAISSFSHRPLQLATLLGFIISTLAFIAIPVVAVLRILGSYLPGFSAVTILILLLGGIELIAIGIIGEYVGRIYDEVKGRPLYLVRARRNMPDTGIEAGTASLPPLHALPPPSGGDEATRPLD
jgi:dolichol-phosphate mannosyltransferase